VSNAIELVSALTARVRQAKAPFAETVLVCSKCAKKFPDHRGAKGVRSALKSALKTKRWGKVRLVETKCLDLCPKKRLVLASGATLANHRLVVVDAGFDADAALVQLLGEPPPEA
jgi:predicted metal-binding protein